ncbi:hypothetical protein [Teredinibacter franksiae]|nr:hypothetical protein [Teredinibacter franksiae]
MRDIINVMVEWFEISDQHKPQAKTVGNCCNYANDYYGDQKCY